MPSPPCSSTGAPARLANYSFTTLPSIIYAQFNFSNGYQVAEGRHLLAVDNGSTIEAAPRISTRSTVETMAGAPAAEEDNNNNIDPTPGTTSRSEVVSPLSGEQSTAAAAAAAAATATSTRSTAAAAVLSSHDPSLSTTVTTTATESSPPPPPPSLALLEELRRAGWFSLAVYGWPLHAMRKPHSKLGNCGYALAPCWALTLPCTILFNPKNKSHHHSNNNSGGGCCSCCCNACRKSHHHRGAFDNDSGCGCHGHAMRAALADLERGNGLAPDDGTEDEEEEPPVRSCVKVVVLLLSTRVCRLVVHLVF